MIPICSCLIPSRSRPEKLGRTIQSIAETASNVEFVVRLDHSDPALVDNIKAVQLYASIHPSRIIVGPRMEGYRSHGNFYDEASRLASGIWVALFNDDTVLYQNRGSEPWEEQLLDIPPHGYIVQPEVSRLGGSTYFQAMAQAVPFVPRNCWKEYGVNEIPFNPDVALHDILENRNRWSTKFLKGVTIWHDRGDDGEIERHRKME